ncbi:MAG: hypothetical protein KDC32_04100 [Saprospiraceae bacterium]|nr:hypothetical protein [Saprospiraceae bacterium]
MPHFTWTYVGGVGDNHHVGLFHGKRTGHVLIHCDRRVIVVDFSVLEDKTYSFFINEELCEVRLERRGDRFYYTFHINTEVDTPRNKARKQIERKHWKQTLLFFAGFLGLTLLVMLGIQWFYSPGKRADDHSALLAREGRQTTATVRIDSLASPPVLTYHFIAGNQAYDGRRDLDFSIPSRLLNGMPVQSGDEFQVSYLPRKPDIHQLEYQLPSDQQVARYKQRALDRHLELHPDEMAAMVRCSLEVAFALKGVAALADFYFQEKSPSENFHHNRLSFSRLIRDLPFQEKVKEECY